MSYDDWKARAPVEEDPHDDPSYQAYIEDAAAGCRNCTMCNEVPCGACLAGGICDQFRCTCDEDTDPMIDEDDQ